jgi:sulfite exporter TauE/SafE
METKTVPIRGMTCIHCQNSIEKALNSTPGVETARVSFDTGMATITYNPNSVDWKTIVGVIEALDYQVVDASHQDSMLPIAGALIIILALYMLVQHFGVSTLAAAFPLAQAGMGYGMLFIIGLITSVHCVAMCGGINLSQSLSGVGAVPVHKGRLMPSILYNAGRVISYTVIGGIVGALGSVITVSGRFQGIVQLVAGVFMVLMGLGMLGILRRFSLRMPRIFAQMIDEHKAAQRSPLIIGLLNGFMPCGPLQAMQLYALSTGSLALGALSMFLFSMGTVPLMFGLGALSSVLTKRFSAMVMRVGAIIIAVMGLSMLSNGWSLAGFSFNFGFAMGAPASGTSADRPRIDDPSGGSEVQMINSTLSGGRYPAITVQVGIPVRWTINAPSGSINGCNNRLIIRAYGIEHQFTPGDNVIEFTPDKTGTVPYSCWMGMIRSTITVVAGGTPAVVEERVSDTAPVPAGVAIPTDAIAVAQLYNEEFQQVMIALRDDGFEPSIIVVQRNVPVAWLINNDSLDEGNSMLTVPAYFTQVPMKAGDNVIQFMPTADFDFSTVDSIYYGYVKVVDDLYDIDIDAIKQEVADFETMMYPDAYFDSLSQGGGACCGGGKVG